jgi:hypothetical protein
MKVSLLDAQHTIFEGAVSCAVVPGMGGELSLMDNHEPIFAVLTKGSIRLQPIVQKITMAPAAARGREAPSSSPGPFFIRRGLARMRGNELVILIE